MSLDNNSILNTKIKTYNGQNLLESFDKLKFGIENIEVRDSDIWLTCFPKTGSTWMHELLWLVANDYNFEKAKEYPERRTPIVERALMSYDTGGNSEAEEKLKPYVANTLDFLPNLPDPRVIKTHMFWDNLPKDIKEEKKKPKIIYLTRNPKDTALSLLNHLKLLAGFNGDEFEFLMEFPEDRVLMGPFFKHVLPFWKRRDDSNILFMTYEEMKMDISAVVLKVVEFLGKSINDKQLAKVLDHLHIDNMRKNKYVNNEEFVLTIKQMSGIAYDGQFINKGVVGAYKEKLTKEMIETFDKWIEENIRGTGLKFN